MTEPRWDLIIRGGTLMDPAQSIAAKERGVVLDVGHASVHCDANVARRAIGEGLSPTTLSTDLHAPPPGRIVYNLRGLMSKFVALGMTVEDVVASVTARAAAAIGKADELGSLAPGMAGDAVVLDLEDGPFSYVDGAGNEVKATRRFRTRHVIENPKERLWECSSPLQISRTANPPGA
jgi:dihydroorotase